MPSRAKHVATAHGQIRDESLPIRQPSRLRVGLFDAFELSSSGSPVHLPMSAQRVIALLALHDRPLLRLYAASTLWLDTSEDRAYANLRTALWRLRQVGCDLIEAEGGQLSLSSGVLVDVREAVELAHRVLEDTIADREAGLASELLTGELLPGWYDDWVVVERERLRQLRLHALEALCERLTAQTRFAEAVDAGLAAVAGEPLRESAHRALIRTHLAEGNQAEAVRQYHVCRRLLHDHLGLAPSRQMDRLVQGLPLRRARIRTFPVTRA